MTHSSRRSYKDKYLKSRQNIHDVVHEAELLSSLSEFQAIAESRRADQYKLLSTMAEIVTEFVELLDSPTGRLGLRVKDIKKPVDTNLPSMDGDLIIRRTRDVLLHAMDRIGMAGLGMEELRDRVATLKTGVILLQPTVERTQRGYMESFEIGKSPSETEILAVRDERGKNPRALGYEYETDIDTSDDEREEEGPISRSLVPSGSNAASNGGYFGKPITASKHAAHRLSDEIDFDD